MARGIPLSRRVTKSCVAITRTGISASAKTVTFAISATAFEASHTEGAPGWCDTSPASSDIVWHGMAAAADAVGDIRQACAKAAVWHSSNKVAVPSATIVRESRDNFMGRILYEWRVPEETGGAASFPGDLLQVALQNFHTFEIIHGMSFKAPTALKGSFQRPP